jgi:hypothetical protein
MFGRRFAFAALRTRAFSALATIPVSLAISAAAQLAVLIAILAIVIATRGDQ